MLVAAITSKAQAKSWNAALKIHSRDIKFKIDTGAQCNVMSFMQASKQPLSRSKARLVAFGGQRITPVGKAVLLCEHKNKFRPIEFEVVDNVSNVLGLGTCEELGLVKRVETMFSASMSLASVAYQESHTTSKLTPTTCQSCTRHEKFQSPSAQKSKLNSNVWSAWE